MLMRTQGNLDEASQNGLGPLQSPARGVAPPTRIQGSHQLRAPSLHVGTSTVDPPGALGRPLTLPRDTIAAAARLPAHGGK